MRTMHQVAVLLQSEGLPATDTRVRYAVEHAGLFIPARNELGYRVFGPAEIEKLRVHFQTPYTGAGRPRTAEPLAIATE